MQFHLDLKNQGFYGGLGVKPCLEVSNDGVRPVRFPVADFELVHPDLAKVLVSQSCVHLRFQTDARQCRLRFCFDGSRLSNERSFPAPTPDLVPQDQLHLFEIAPFDLFVNGEFFARKTNDPPIKGLDFNKLWPGTLAKPVKDELGPALIANLGKLMEELQKVPQEKLRPSEQGEEIVFGNLPEGRKQIELYLPQAVPVKLLSLNLVGGEGGPPMPIADSRLLLVTYGSSITHGVPFANGPSSVWPAVAARAANLRLVNFGVGGQCHFDLQMARMIRDMPADFFAFKMGINVHNLGSMNMRTFAEALTGFLLTVREGHPKTPMCVISPIWGGFRETEGWDTELGFCVGHCPALTEMRQMVKGVVELLQKRGDVNLHYVDGLEIMGADMASMMPDDLHPNGDGYERMGHRFAERLFGPKGVLMPGRVAENHGAAPVPQRPSSS